jgi:GNAT superfamily N-acetyltransferase
VEPPRPATTAPKDELLELVHQVRQELLLRDEAPTGDWIEETVEDLKRGRKPGWFYPGSDGGGVAFYTERAGDAFAHVHVPAGPDESARASELTRAMLDGLPATVRSVDVGFTGLTVEAERRLLEDLARRPGSQVIERAYMERALSAADGERRPSIPAGLRLVPIRAVTVDALADLDWRAFRGSVDALLIGNDPVQYRRVLLALLDGEMGRFLDEASIALLVPEPPRLAGALLTTERSARKAVFVDFMVDPEMRHRGYGRFLFEWGLRALWALGYERVGLWVTRSNEAARRMYEQAGLVVTARAAIYRWERGAETPQAHSAA